MKKTLLLIAALLSFAASANANPVTVETARRVATNFWNHHRPADTKTAGTVAELTFGELPHLHIFDVDGMGFVIVSGDNRVMPVLAYSFNNTFPTELNPELGYWMHGYEEQVAAVAKSDLVASESIVEQWATLASAKGLPDTPKDLTAVPAMLTTQWAQGSPYNKFCPYDSTLHGRAVVGCVATAMAQIMKYWNYPAFGQGSNTYQPTSMWETHSSYPVQSVDFSNSTYLWQFMPDMVSQLSYTYERDAVAKISYHCGVAVNMMYGLSSQGGSGAYSSCGPWSSACAYKAFWQYFKYDTSLFYDDRFLYTDSAWCELINEQLALGHPMYYHGSDNSGGHAFVLDGSDLESRYHFNWGWAGSGDGFYAINNLAPGSGGTGGNSTYTFNQDQGAIFGIKPAFEEVFDTADYYDTACTNMQYITFHDYNLQVAEMDTLLRHLGTIYRYHLTVLPQKRILLNPNISGMTPDLFNYCPATGFTFPQCSYEKEGCMFFGWCRSKTGDDTIYQPGEHIDITVNRTYFALWLDTTNNVGIEAFERDELRLWPNPTNGEITITVPTSMGSILVTDILGRVVLRDDNPHIINGDAKISLESLPDGIYNVQVKTAVGVYNQRIIKR